MNCALGIRGPSLYGNALLAALVIAVDPRLDLWSGEPAKKILVDFKMREAGSDIHLCSEAAELGFILAMEGVEPY